MSALRSLSASSRLSDSAFRAAATLFVAAFLAISAILSFRHQGGIVFPDEHEYYELAENLVKYRMLTWDGITPTAARPPGFVFWLAIGKAIGLGWSALVWLNALLVTAGLWVLTGAWFSASRLWAGRAVVFALLFCYPVSLYVTSTLYPQAFCLALIAFSLALMMKGKVWAGALAGGLMAWCVLAAPIYAPWAGIAVLISIFHWRLRGFVSAGTFVLLFAVVIAAWGIRNETVLGRFVPFSTNSGFNLLIGNCETTRPNAGLNIDVTKYTNEVLARKLGEADADAFYARAAREWIAQNPAAAVSLYFQKVLNYFNFRNELVTASAASPARDAVMFLTYYALLALLLARIVFGRASNPLEWRDWLILGGYLACALFTSIATTRIRYRIPNDILAMLVAAPFVADLARFAFDRTAARFLRK
ncbi:MAG TPA: hypothetical protein VIM61_08970 [Chthoniobacterales bacterium]